MKHLRIAATLPLLCLLLLGLAACGGKGDDSGGGAVLGGAESPEALVEMARGLAEKDDFGGIITLVAPDERPLMSMGMMMMAKMAPMFLGGMGAAFGGEEAKAELDKKMKPFNDAMDAALKKHGLDKLDMEQGPPGGMQDPESAAKWIHEQVPDLDHGAFVADVMDALASLGDKAQGKASKGFKDLGGEMKDLKVEGDDATATLNDKPMFFRKVDGRWYFAIAKAMR